MTRIVVGVDGTDASFDAVRWAVAEARVVGATVEVVHAWSLPTVGTSVGAGLILDGVQLEESARIELQHAMSLADVDGASVVPTLVCGPPATVLAQVARGADLLVVGSHGRGALARAFLGSVSQRLAQHPPCPVVIVPPSLGA